MGVSMAFHDLNLAGQFLTLTDFEARLKRARVVEILRSELELAMILCACARAGEISKAFLWQL